MRKTELAKTYVFNNHIKINRFRHFCAFGVGFMTKRNCFGREVFTFSILLGVFTFEIFLSETKRKEVF